MASPYGIHTYREGVYTTTGGAATITSIDIDAIEGFVAGNPAQIQAELLGSYPETGTNFLLRSLVGLSYNGTVVTPAQFFDWNNGTVGAYNANTLVRIGVGGGSLITLSEVAGLDVGRRLYWRLYLSIAVQDPA